MDEYIKREDALDAVLFALVGTGVQSRAIYAIREVPTADLVPKSEVEKWQDRCREWYSVAELKSNCIMELDEGLAKANAEIERLRGILLQFTDIVHKWGAKNGIDTSEISLVPILQKEADSIVGKMEQEIETLKDNNEHLR